MREVADSYFTVGDVYSQRIDALTPLFKIRKVWEAKVSAFGTALKEP